MKKSIGPFVLAAAIAGGAGALAFVPSLAGAESTTTTTTTPPAASAARSDGLKSVLDGLVADGTITQDQADKVLSRLQSQLPRGGKGGVGFPKLRAATEEIASYLGLTPAELKTALEGGKTLAQVAADKGKSVDGLIAAIVAAGTKAIDTAVTDGKLTADQATALKAKLTDQATRIVNEARPADGPRGPGKGLHPRGGDRTPTTTAPAS